MLSIIKILTQEDMVTFDDCLQTLRDVAGRLNFAIVCIGCL